MSILNWQRRLERAALLHNEGDLIRATVGRDVYAAANGDKDAAWQTLVAPAPVGLGLHPNTAVAIKKMGEALVALDDESVWRAAGWPGVRALLKLPASRRKAAIRDVLKEAAGTELGKATVRVIVCSHGGKAPAKEPKTPAKPAESWQMTVKTEPDPVEHALANELRRLFNDPLIGESLKRYLDKDVIALLQAAKTKKAS